MNFKNVAAYKLLAVDTQRVEIDYHTAIESDSRLNDKLATARLQQKRERIDLINPSSVLADAIKSLKSDNDFYAASMAIAKQVRDIGNQLFMLGDTVVFIAETERGSDHKLIVTCVPENADHPEDRGVNTDFANLDFSTAEFTLCIDLSSAESEPPGEMSLTCSTRLQMVKHSLLINKIMQLNEPKIASPSTNLRSARHVPLTGFLESMLAFDLIQFHPDTGNLLITAEALPSELKTSLMALSQR